MIKGVLLGISVAVFLTSLLIIITGASGLLQENLATGAVIGTSGAVSYAIIALVLSMVGILFLSLILRNPRKKVGSYNI